jgi:hypothetical protein
MLAALAEAKHPLSTLFISANECVALSLANESRVKMMTDLSKQDIVKRLAGGSVMRRWGAIATWARDQLNLLLRDQYLQGYTSP